MNIYSRKRWEIDGTLSSSTDVTITVHGVETIDLIEL